jgi:hypothetical protein
MHDCMCVDIYIWVDSYHHTRIDDKDNDSIARSSINKRRERTSNDENEISIG